MKQNHSSRWIQLTILISRLTFVDNQTQRWLPKSCFTREKFTIHENTLYYPRRPVWSFLFCCTLTGISLSSQAYNVHNNVMYHWAQSSMGRALLHSLHQGNQLCQYIHNLMTSMWPVHVLHLCCKEQRVVFIIQLAQCTKWQLILWKEGPSQLLWLVILNMWKFLKLVKVKNLIPPKRRPTRRPTRRSTVGSVSADMSVVCWPTCR